MGLVSGILERRSANWSISELDWLMERFLGGATLATGKALSTTETLQIDTVHACVSLLADATASLPLHLYRRLPKGQGRARAFDHPVYSLLHDIPNPEMTAYVYKETIVGHLALWGNHYSYIEYDDRGVNVVALWPLRPDRMQISRGEDKQLHYLYRLPSGEQRELMRSEVFHIPYLSFDGVLGMAPVEMARQSIGLAQAQEEYAARFFGSSANPGGILTHPKTLTDGARDRMKASWESLHKGLERSHRVAILEEGVTWQAIGIPPEQAQFLESRKYSVEAIARIFRVPLHMIGHNEKATSWGTGIEQMSIGFAVYTLAPTWLARIEQQISKDLLTEAERQYLYAAFLIDGLLRGDIKSRYEAYAIGRGWGWMSVNDVRFRENMNGIGPEGDSYLIPLNMVPADQEPSADVARAMMRIPPVEQAEEERALAALEARYG